MGDDKATQTDRVAVGAFLLGSGGAKERDAGSGGLGICLVVEVDDGDGAAARPDKERRAAHPAHAGHV